MEDTPLTEGVIIIGKSKKKDNTMIKKKRQKENKDLQNITRKTKDRATRRPLKPEGMKMGVGVNSSVAES